MSLRSIKKPMEMEIRRCTRIPQNSKCSYKNCTEWKQWQAMKCKHCSCVFHCKCAVDSGCFLYFEEEDPKLCTSLECRYCKLLTPLQIENQVSMEKAYELWGIKCGAELANES